jgi:hypothetical protein
LANRVRLRQSGRFNPSGQLKYLLLKILRFISLAVHLVALEITQLMFTAQHVRAVLSPRAHDVTLPVPMAMHMCLSVQIPIVEGTCGPTSASNGSLIRLAHDARGVQGERDGYPCGGARLDPLARALVTCGTCALISSLSLPL